MTLTLTSSPPPEFRSWPSATVSIDGRHQLDEIAPAFVDLAWAGASHITGQVLAADDGLTIR